MMQLFWQCLGLLLLAIYALPLLAFLALPICLIFFITLQLVLTASADALRWESISRSPVQSLLTVALGGGLPAFRSRSSFFFN